MDTDAPAATGPTYIGTPLPDYEEHKTIAGPTVGSTTTQETISPEQATRLGALDTASTDVQRAREAEGVQRGAEALAEAAGAQKQADVAAWEQAQLDTPQMKAANDYVAWARQHTKDEEARLGAMPPPSLFADKQGWEKVRGYVGLGLAGLGDAVTAAAMVRAGHAPSGHSTVGELIDKDVQRQKDAIDKLKDSVVMARTGLKDATEARAALLADVDLRGKYMAKNAEAITKARLAAMKVPATQIDTMKDVADLRQKQAQYEADYVKGHSSNVSKRYESAKTTTEQINRNPLAGAGMLKAEKDIALDEQGQAEGRVVSGRGGAMGFTAQDVGLQTGIASLKALRDHVQKFGERPTDPQAIKDRATLYDRAVLAIASASPMGKNEEAQHLEAGTIGPSGAPSAREGILGSLTSVAVGANPQAIQAKIEELEHRRSQLRKQTIVPLTPAEQQAFSRPTTNAKAGPTPAESEFTAERVKIARTVASDPKRTRFDRDNARAYIKAAYDAGVR